MLYSIMFNGKPIEKLEKRELISVIEAVCEQLEECKKSVKWWKAKYEEAGA